MTDTPESGQPLRGLDVAQFVEMFGGVYEHSPWVAEAIVDARGDATGSVEALARAMAAVVDSAGRDAQLALIRAHPDLAGRAAVAGELTEASSAEQASAGLDRCTPAEFERLRALNDAYRAKFDFPFILAVRGRTRTEIIAAIQRRLGNDAETEFATALEEIHTIARLRLQAIAEVL